MKYNYDRIIEIVKKWETKDLSLYRKLGESYYKKKISDIEKTSNHRC